MLKTIANAAAWLLAAPIAYPIAWSRALDPRDQLFRSGSQAVALVPGIFGVFMRRQFYGITLASVGPGFTVEFGTIFSRRDTRIGSDVYIGAYCTIGLCDILDDVLIGSGVDVVSGQRVHNFERPDLPIRLQGGELVRISVGPDAWLGNKAVVMASVAEGCVVGAGSVVTSAGEPQGIYVGIPAKRLRARTPPMSGGSEAEV